MKKKNYSLTAEKKYRSVLLQQPALMALILISLAGLGVSIYLTTVHYARVPLVCNVNSLINCATVTSSVYSVIPGTTLPITLPGILWFLFSGSLAAGNLYFLKGSLERYIYITLIHFLWSLAGLLAVLYLIYIEIVLLHQICEWCTIVHLCIAATFVITLYKLQMANQENQELI